LVLAGISKSPVAISEKYSEKVWQKLPPLDEIFQAPFVRQSHFRKWSSSFSILLA
jgi:hypothetical protein